MCVRVGAPLRAWRCAPFTTMLTFSSAPLGALRPLARPYVDGCAEGASIHALTGVKPASRWAFVAQRVHHRCVQLQMAQLRCAIWSVWACVRNAQYAHSACNCNDSVSAVRSQCTQSLCALRAHTTLTRAFGFAESAYGQVLLRMGAMWSCYMVLDGDVELHRVCAISVHSCSCSLCLALHIAGAERSHGAPTGSPMW
jgi:hypothetical protein